MNALSEFVENHLIVTSSPDYLQELYKLCLEKVKTGRHVVVITSKFYDFSNLLLQIDIYKDYLKKLIIMEYKTLDDMSCKLLQLHSWSILPSLVVVDLSQLLMAPSATCLASTSLMQKVTLCTVSLLVYLQSIGVQLPKYFDGHKLSKTTGLLILRSDLENFGISQIQTLKDLYFYKTDVYQDFADISSLLLEDGGE